MKFKNAVLTPKNAFFGKMSLMKKVLKWHLPSDCIYKLSNIEIFENLIIFILWHI